MNEPRPAISNADRALANAEVASALIMGARRAGISRVVLAPGARSTPLVLAIRAAAQTSEELTVHVVHDERSAAFVALGASRADGTPTLVVTTSGTAVANLLPAATEAHLDGVPLLFLSADRPPVRYERGENQAIDQAMLLQPVVRARFDLAPAEACAKLSVENTMALAVATTLGPVRGPAHINVRFEKPLTTPASVALLQTLAEKSASVVGVKWHAPTCAPPVAALADLRKTLATATRGLVVFGRFASPAERTAAVRWAKRLNWPTLSCAVSGAPVPANTGADVLVEVPAFRDVRPDFVLWLGGTLVSERVMAWLKQTGAQVTQVDPRPRGFDPKGAVTTRVMAAIESTSDALASADVSSSALAPRVASLWTSFEAARRAELDAEESWTEAAIARRVAKSVRRGEALFLGASMPVRDVDAFAAPLIEGATVFANRGASGIDGVLSSAAGVALTGRPTTLLIGDVSLLHDASGMSALAQMGPSLRIVVVDNRGGGIFSFLPLARENPETVDPWFSSPPAGDLDFAALARSVGLRVHTAVDAKELRTLVDTPITAPEVVVVQTDRKENVRAHDTLRAALIDAVTKRAGQSA